MLKDFKLLAKQVSILCKTCPDGGKYINLKRLIDHKKFEHDYTDGSEKVLAGGGSSYKIKDKNRNSSAAVFSTNQRKRTSTAPHSETKHKKFVSMNN